MLTGLYPHANGTLGNDVSGYRVPRLDQMLPTFNTLLHDAGYRCGMASQHEGLNPKGIDDLLPGYENFKERLRKQGVLPTGDPASVPGTPREGLPVASLDKVRDYEYIKDGLKLLDAYAQQDKPWLLSIELDGPHLPCTPLKAWWDRISPDSFELPASRHDSLSDRASRHRRIRRNAGFEEWDDEQWRAAIRLYRAVMAMQDDFLGQVLEKLQEHGCEENTLVIFSSDHGDLVGHHGILTKYGPCMDETILRTPLVMRWPQGITAGQVNDAFISSTDWLPTFCELAGIEPPAFCHGQSLVPFFKGGRSTSWREGVVTGYYGNGGHWYTLRSYQDEHYKYTWDPYGMDEFYNLKEDPDERHNQVGNPQYRHLVEQYADKLAEALQEVDDPLVLQRSRMVPLPGQWFEDGMG
jgi:arylsulfatase A-like enzyme